MQACKILFFLLIITSSCSVKYSLNNNQLPAEAKTVSVAYFENQAALASPTVAQFLTQALRDKFLQETRLNLVDQNGDLQINSIITGYHVSTAGVAGNETTALSRLTLTLSVEYINSFNEEDNFTSSFSAFADFDPSQSLPVVETQLLQDISTQLNTEIFNRSFQNW